ncbi:ribonuclease H-like domain-containing protein [Tanacetum coccineum]
MHFMGRIKLLEHDKELCTAFEKLMKDKFQMSSMGELTFVLGLQVTQKEDGIFISQDKYVAEILKKFNYTDVKSASTPVDLEKPLAKHIEYLMLKAFTSEVLFEGRLLMSICSQAWMEAHVGDEAVVHKVLNEEWKRALPLLLLALEQTMTVVTSNMTQSMATLNEPSLLGNWLVASLEQDLKQTKKVYSNAYTKLIMRVKMLEHKVKSRQPRRRARVVISDTEEDLEHPSKQGRRIAEIDQNPSISLVQDEGTSWIQEDAKIQGRTKISTANISVSTASATPEVSTAAENLVYIRMSAEKRIDKGKAIIKEDESINEEERQRIARDAEIAKQLQEEFDRARQEQEVVAEADQAHDIDWSDPAVLRYHALQNRSFSVAEVRKNMCMYLKNQGGYKQSHFKGMSYEDIRLIFERVWDQNHAFVPKDSEIKKEVMKRPGFDFPQKSIKKNDDSQQQAGSSKKRSREDSDEDNAKKQKLEDDAEKEELRDSMDVVPRDDIAIDVESLATKYPIVDWKTRVLIENMLYYQIIRADGSSKNYKMFSEMLDDFDRQYVMDLHRLVQERYDTTSLQGYDLLLWGDLKILFEPNEEDEI